MKRIMKEFRMTEISAVNRPAQQGARAVIMKADVETKTEDGKSYPASDYAYVPDKTKPSTWKLRLTSEPGGDPDPKIVGAAVAALSPTGYRGNPVDIPQSARAGVMARVKAAWRKANPDKKPADMPDHMRKYADPLVGLILKNLPGDTDGDAYDFSTAYAGIEASEQIGEVMSELSEMWSALMSSINSIQCDDEMSPDQKLSAIKGSIVQYVTMLRERAPDGLTEAWEQKLAGGSAGDPVDKKETSMSDEMKKVADLEKQIADLTKRATEAESKVADLTKAAEIAKSDETFEADGATIRKSDVGETTFKFMKAQQERIELSDFEKAASAQVPNLPGETVAKAKVLRAVSKLDKDTAEALTAMLKAGNEAMAKMLKPIGTDAGRAFSKAEDELAALANAYAEKHSVNYAKAYSEVLKTNEGKRLYAEIGTPSANAA